MKYIEGIANRLSETMKEVIENPMNRGLGNFNYIQKEIDKLKSDALRDLKIAKAEKNFGLEKEALPSIAFKNSNIGILNLGEIQGNIEKNVINLERSGYKDIAKILREFTEDVNNLKNEFGEKYDELLSHIKFLTEEAIKPQEKRNVSIIKNTFRYIH